MEYHKRIKREHLAYFAGLLDGEGCVGVSKFKNSSGEIRYRAFCQIAMTDRRPIDWLLEHIGGRLYVDRKLRQNLHKICYVWRMNAKEAAAALEQAMPFILVKKEQSLNCIALAQTLTGQGGRGINKPVPKAVLEVRQAIFEDNRRLNQKGRAA